MKELLSIIVILVCLFLAYEDLKKKQVSIVTLLLFALSTISLGFLKINLATILLNTLIVGLFGLGIVVLSIFKRIPLRELIGMGDVLFLLPLIVLLQPFALVVLVLVSSILGLFYIAFSRTTSIPYISFLALVLIGIVADAFLFQSQILS